MKAWLILQTILFESASLYLLQNEQLTSLQWISYASSHALAVASFTALCWMLLPLQYKRPLLGSAAFIFIIAFSIPLVGMLGLGSVFLVALYLPKKKELMLWQRSEFLDLPLSPESVDQGQFGTAALRDILLFNPSAERRLIAVNACRFLPEKTAIPLLVLALKDTVDDVRLLAYAAIEKIEFRINQDIEKSKQQLKKQSTPEKANQIAQLYWELCYLGLADGALKQHYLQQAKSYLLDAENQQPMVRSQLLLGRVLLALNEFSQAKGYLLQAQKSGLLTKQVAPYLAEVAFSQNDFNAVRHYLEHLPSQQGDRLSEIKEYWYCERD